MRKFKLITLMMMLSILFTSPVAAFKQEDLNKLKSTNKCEKCDLNGVGLGLANLSKADLSSAKLDGSKSCHTKMPDGKENNSGCLPK